MKASISYLIFFLLSGFVAFSQNSFNAVSKGQYTVTVFGDGNNSSDSVWIAAKFSKKKILSHYYQLLLKWMGFMRVVLQIH